MNRKNLANPEIKHKIGTLYSGLKAKDPKVMMHSFVFLLRRSVFIVITFLLFNDPGVQLLLMLKMTILYLIYLGYVGFFKSFGSKALEIVNESVFLLIQYQLIVLHHLVWQEWIREAIGTLIIAMTSFLLIINFIVVIVVSVWPKLRKLYLQHWIQRKAVARRDALVKVKMQSLTMGNIASPNLRKIHDEQTKMN